MPANVPQIDGQAVVIRDYEDPDYDELAQSLQDGNLFNTDWDSRDNLKNKIRLHPGSILVACVGNRVIGCVYTVSDAWAAFIFRLAVRREYRGHGVGQLLMEAAEDRLRRSGYCEAAIFVNESDTGLQDFYSQKLRYTPTGSYRCMYKVL